MNGMQMVYFFGGISFFMVFFIIIIIIFIRDAMRQEKERKGVEKLSFEIKRKFYDATCITDLLDIRKDILGVIENSNKSKYKFIYTYYINELNLLFIQQIQPYANISGIEK